MRSLILTVGVLLLAGVLPSPGARAQQRYAVGERLAEADWATEPVADGVTWRRAQLDGLFGLRQSLNVLDVDLTVEGIEVDVASADSGRVPTSVLAEEAGAVAAVNGSFFDMERGGTVVFSQSDGRSLRQSLQKAPPPFRSEAAVAARRDGDATVIRREGTGWRPLPDYEDVLASGPLLLWEGALAPMAPTGFNVTHHPRTALGVTASGDRLLLVTVDGRAPEAAGLTTRELAWVMQGLGAAAALNLDGGGSTTMWVRGRGVVSHPSDNDAFDPGGERAVANAVVVRFRE